VSQQAIGVSLKRIAALLCCKNCKLYCKSYKQPGPLLPQTLVRKLVDDWNVLCGTFLSQGEGSTIEEIMRVLKGQVSLEGCQAGYQRSVEGALRPQPGVQGFSFALCLVAYLIVEREALIGE
jgi:hypothetical protein